MNEHDDDDIESQLDWLFFIVNEKNKSKKNFTTKSLPTIITFRSLLSSNEQVKLNQHLFSCLLLINCCPWSSEMKESLDQKEETNLLDQLLISLTFFSYLSSIYTKLNHTKWWWFSYHYQDHHLHFWRKKFSLKFWTFEGERERERKREKMKSSK